MPAPDAELTTGLVDPRPPAGSAAPAPAARRPRGQGARTAGEIGVFVLLFAFLLGPFYWMATTSLKDTNDAFAVPPKIFVFPVTFEHYEQVLHQAFVVHGLVSSLVVTLASTGLALLLGVPAAYVLARFDFRGKKDLLFWFISNRFISPIVVALPFFLIARNLGLLDTWRVLVLIYLTFNVPLVVWMTLDQFRSVPVALDEAAKLDGCGVWQSFWRVNLPLALPGVVVSAILCFIFSWNELLFALELARDHAKTAPVAATNFMTGFGVRWGEMMATGTLIVLPVVIFACCVSHQLVKGLTTGAVK